MRTLLKNIVHTYQRPNSQKWIAICLIFCFTLSFLFGNTAIAGASSEADADTDSVSASDTVSDATVSDSASDQTEDSVSSNPSDTSSEDFSDITSDDSSSDFSDPSADTTTDKDTNDTSGNASNNTEDANQDSVSDASSDNISDETPSDQTPSDPQETYHILFHDIQADGNEYFPENNEIPALTVSSDETLAEVLLDHSFTLPSDEIAVEQCVWYTLEESGEKIPYDLTSPITADLDLYTYTYQLTLSVSQETAQSLPDMDGCIQSVSISFGIAVRSIRTGSLAALPNSDTEEEDSAEEPYLTKTITAREGQPLDPESLKIDTVDCADLVWTDLETFEPIDAQELQENGLTQNYEVLAASQIAGTVTCYVLVNEQWIPLTTLTAHAPDKNNPSNQEKRYYITSTELEEIYKGYGFSANDYHGERIFPHTDSNSLNTLWADTVPWLVGDTYHVPLTGYSSRVSYLYYLPENRSGNATYFDGSKNVEDASMKKANTFYTVTISDPTDSIYPEGTLPKEQLVFQGESLEVTLPQAKGVTWNVTDAKTQNSLTLSSKEDPETNTITFTIDHIQCPIAFTASTGQKLVHCYAAIDGAWKLVKTAEVSGEESFGSQRRFYITASRLKSIYENYGLSFPEINSTENLSFPHTDSKGPGTIWADVPLLDRNNDYYIPLGDTATSCSYYNLYYLPNNTESFTSKSLTDTGGNDLRNNNTFYSVTVEDSQGLLDDSQLSNTRYILNNHDYSVTLPWKETFTWTAVNSDTNAIIPITSNIDESNQTITLSIKTVSCPIRLTTVTSNMQIEYSTDVFSSLLTIDSVSPENQTILQNGTLGGSSTHSEKLPNAAYAVLSPDQEIAEVKLPTKGEQHIFYRFVGWKVKNSTYILKPGETIEPWEQTRYDINHTGTISLIAQWSPDTQIGGINRHISVNFFLNLNCEIMDNQEDGFQSQPKEKFTASVFSTIMKNTENASNTEQGLINTATKDNASATDEEIRKLVETPVRGYFLSAFPSDEEIFAELRAKKEKIYVDGNESTAVSSEDLTTENFRIRWYVVKYEGSDGWHIDGILVAKEANVTVTKTFVGDAEAIEQVKRNGYSIQVTHQDIAANGGKTVDYKLTLKPASEENGKTQIGYTNYDSATNTYTWVLSGRQKRQYTFKEQNYQLSESSWSTSSRYRIVNSETNDTNQWLPYSDTSDVSVIAQAYPKDVSYEAYQTIRFRNTYTKAGVLNLFKVDATSGNGMTNVSFRISKKGTDGKYQPLPLYQKAKESQYSYQKDDTYTTDSSGMICTDSRGHLDIKLEQGTYRLEETRFPEGYTGASSIEFTVNGKGTIGSEIDITAPDEVPSPTYGWASLTTDSAGNATTLTVRNQSKLLTTVTAQKIWDSTPESAQQPVTVELWCNGAKVSGNYTAALNKENNWIHQWHNLPLFVDGKLAAYSLRETKIGDEAYDATIDKYNDNNGYANYTVTRKAPLYREDDGEYRNEGTWTENEKTHYANQALLNVHNRTTKTIFSFQKTDLNGDPLPGAVFDLFADAACTKWVVTATSDQNGYVTFAPLPSGQTYYLKERSAPEGYLLSTEIYQAKVLDDGNAVIQKLDGTIVTKIQNTPLYVLPTTGGLGSMPWTLSGTLLLCTGATLWFRRRKQNE